MRRDLLPNLVIVLGIMLLPLVWVPHRLMHPAPWVAMAVGLVLLFSQPPLERKETVSPTAEDRLSALGIYGAMVTAQLVSVMDYGFVRREGPEAASPLWVGAVVCTIAGLAFRIDLERDVLVVHDCGNGRVAKRALVELAAPEAVLGAEIENQGKVF